ncbi:MAG TPA: hypothetical protein VMX36_12295 [Sedimentisphaerales bacterium]|nr:hypothetical protein [Sedimentisphaerales bacterium]
MKPADNIYKLIKKLQVEPSADVDRKVHNRITKALEKWKKTKSAYTQPNFWRMIIKSKITKIATAAVLMLVVVLLINFLDKSVTPAYSLEQTIQANNTLRYLHTKYFHGERNDLAKECWLEFDESGRTKNLRINWSAVYGSEVVVWNENETKIWNAKNNFLNIFNDEIYTFRVHEMKESDDPKLIVEQLHDQDAKGLVKIEIDESGNKKDPIVVTVTYLPDSPKYGSRKVLFVDRSTYLTTRMELYVLKEGKYTYLGVIKYFDSNVPIDEKMFSLADEVPKDARLIDIRAQDIGLAQGDLADEEIAVKVVQEFIEALITKDYTRAGLICGELLPSKVEKSWGRLKIIRLISVDKPVQPEKTSRMLPRRLQVPCTIEIEKDGRIIQHSRSFSACTVIGKRQNWQIGGSN